MTVPFWGKPAPAEPAGGDELGPAEPVLSVLSTELPPVVLLGCRWEDIEVRPVRAVSCDGGAPDPHDWLCGATEKVDWVELDGVPPPGCCCCCGLCEDTGDPSAVLVQEMPETNVMSPRPASRFCCVLLLLVVVWLFGRLQIPGCSGWLGPSHPPEFPPWVVAAGWPVLWVNTKPCGSCWIDWVLETPPIEVGPVCRKVACVTSCPALGVRLRPELAYDWWLSCVSKQEVWEGWLPSLLGSME